MGTKQKKSYWLRVRLTVTEKHKLRSYAEGRDVSDSHVIREYIRRLPNPLNKEL